jgi:hypothetical protein
MYLGLIMFCIVFCVRNVTFIVFISVLLCFVLYFVFEMLLLSYLSGFYYVLYCILCSKYYFYRIYLVFTMFCIVFCVRNATFIAFIWGLLCLVLYFVFEIQLLSYLSGLYYVLYCICVRNAIFIVFIWFLLCFVLYFVLEMLLLPYLSGFYYVLYCILCSKCYFHRIYLGFIMFCIVFCVRNATFIVFIWVSLCFVLRFVFEMLLLSVSLKGVF